MLNGFERETHELTSEELDKVATIMKGLSNKIGKDNAVTSSKICEAMNLSGPRLRKIINHIRIYNLVPALCGSSKGYYVAKDKDELDQYLISLKQRISAQIKVLHSLEKQDMIFGGTGQTTIFD